MQLKTVVIRTLNDLGKNFNKGIGHVKLEIENKKK